MYEYITLIFESNYNYSYTKQQIYCYKNKCPMCNGLKKVKLNRSHTLECSCDFCNGNGFIYLDFLDNIKFNKVKL